MVESGNCVPQKALQDPSRLACDWEVNFKYGSRSEVRLTDGFDKAVGRGVRYYPYGELRLGSTVCNGDASVLRRLGQAPESICTQSTTCRISLVWRRAPIELGPSGLNCAHIPETAPGSRLGSQRNEVALTKHNGLKART